MNLLAAERKDNNSSLSPNEIPDELLVTAAQYGDSEAFVELSKRHSRRLLLKIYRMTNNWQDAEDVLQDALIKAFTHLHTFESRSSYATWLTRIAINSALMLLRRRRHSRTVSMDEVIQPDGVSETFELRDTRDGPEQSYARLQTEERLTRGIRRMRRIHREVLELRQIGDLTMDEIAQSLSISVPAVKSRLLRARNELRQYVQ